MNLLTVILIVGIGVLCFYCSKSRKKEKRNESKPKSSKSVSEKSATVISTITSQSRRRIKSKESVRSPQKSARSLKVFTNPVTLSALITSTSLRQGACHCGNLGHFNIADKLPQPDLRHPYRTANEPVMRPIDYGSYVPVDLSLSPLEKKTMLCMNAVSDVVELPLNVLTAFNPTLHTIYFAHHYAEMLNELLENYHYLE